MIKYIFAVCRDTHRLDEADPKHHEDATTSTRRVDEAFVVAPNLCPKMIGQCT